MKKKESTYSAFFNRRTLLGFTLCILGLAIALVALSGLTGAPAQAQGVGRKAESVKVDQASVPSPKILDGVKPILSRPLREMKIIQSSAAPGHDHPEPMRPAPPTEGEGVDTVRQTSLGPVLSAPSPTGVSWDGVGVGLAGFAPGSNPPDVNGRVGVTQYVQWNNTSFAVFNKSTGALLYGPVAGNTLFQSLGGVCASHNDGDPVVSYDILAGRWVLSQFAVDGPVGSASHQCVAVSATDDATGTYYLYDFVTDTVNFVDYPHTGVWPDGYYMSAHVFNAAGTSFLFARVYVFEREKMILGQPARMQSSNLTGSQFGFLPGDLDSLTPPPVGEAAFVLGPHPTNRALTSSTRVAVTWGATPTIALTQSTIANTTTTNATCVGSASARQCVPQAGQPSTAALDNIRDHFMYRLAYRNNGTQASPQESLLANITVRGGVTPNFHDAIRWYEFRNAGNSTATPTLFQQSTFDPDNDFRWLGSMAMDKDGNISLAYSKSSATTFPSIWITGRLAADAVNTMGSEVLMQAGGGSQDATGGNRWGDYSSMTLDPVDQCTFYYTNEYLKTTGGFNWSTRIAAFRFPSCTDATPWGTVTGTIISNETGAPIQGVIVMLSNGYASATNAQGVYSILVPSGSYTASATDPTRNCVSATPTNTPVSVAVAGTSTQDFVMTGTSKLEANGYVVNDSANGNANGIVNRSECVALTTKIKNNGCGKETAISATLTTTTPGVTITNGTSTFPDMAIDAVAANAVPFQFSTSNAFVCGTNIDFSLNLTYASGTKTVSFSLPSCAGGANQTIPATSITTTDASQPDRQGRDGVPSTCAGKNCPAAINSAGTRNYKTFTFNNASGAPRCFTVTINAALGGGGDIQSAAYQGSYSPPIAQGDPTGNICLNYLGDTGISGLGTTVGSASYSFTVAPQSNFVIVVNTATGSTNSSIFSGTVAGFVDQTPGPGDCPAVTATPPTLTSASSRMGGFDTPISINSSPLGIEDRNGAGNFTLVMNFDAPIQSGSASVTSGAGTAGTATVSGNSLIIPLSGIADQHSITVTATNVTGTNGGVLPSISMNVGYLVGDTNGDGEVNAADISQTKSQSGMTLNAANCREDVTNDGAIDSGDIGLVRSKSGTALQ